MSWELIKLKRGIFSYKEAWDILNVLLYDSNPYSESLFIENLLKYFCKGRECLCVHHESERIDCIFIIEPKSLCEWHLFLPSQSQLGPLLMQDAKTLESLWKRLPLCASRITFLAQDSFYDRFDGTSLPIYSFNYAKTINIQLNGDFHGYWMSRSKCMKKMLSNRFNRVERNGLPLRFVVKESINDMPKCIDCYAYLESTGWKGRAGTAVLVDSDQGRFYKDLMVDFAQRGRAFVYELYLGDAIIAARLCIASDSMLVILKKSYNEKYSGFSPGSLLLYKLLQYEFNRQKFTSVELYTDADINMQRWGTGVRIISHVTLFRYEWMRMAYLRVKQMRDKLREQFHNEHVVA